MKDFIQDRKTLDILRQPENKLIMIIGGIDSGKTTLVERLGAYLLKDYKVGIVDLDMGQSHIGPPTTIAWGSIKDKFNSWDDVNIKMIYFVGTLSPMGNLLPTIVGTKLIVEDAAKKSQKVIIDTTGFVAEPQGRILKQNKIDMLKPDIILVLEEARELDNILGCYRSLDKPKVIDVPIPKTVLKKNIARRAEYRLQVLKKYFSGSKCHEFLLEKVHLRFTGTDFITGSLDLKDRVVSFRNKENKDLAIGVVEKIDLRQNKIFINSPLVKNEEVEYIIAGAVSHPLSRPVF